MRASLVISTYNWPAALRAVLQSVRAQRVLPAEVVIADDGSGPDTRDMIAWFARDFPIPLRHVWHEDQGFRAATIRNKAIAAAHGSYIIQLDGDLVLHQDFVAAHLAFARPGAFVQGSRVLLGEAWTARCLATGETPATPFARGIRNRLNAVNLPWLSTVIRGSRDPFHRVRGCNLAFWRADAIRVNGYNEDIQGWGREDNEFVLRLGNAGIRRRNLKFGAIAWHLHHEYRSRADVTRNHAMLERARSEHVVRCATGIDQWIDTADANPASTRDAS
jgi:glycosyltransferase involved in cell wall biosynthesis